MKRRPFVVGLVIATMAGCALDAWSADAVAPGVTLKIAWMRPAAAGMSDAQAYVDIVNDSGSDLELVGASSSIAKKIELVQVTLKSDTLEQKVVATMPVPGGKTTRLAYRGNHLRLLEITRDAGNGSVVPLTLAFKSAEGKDVTASINVQVRGLLSPQQMPALGAREAAPAGKDALPAAKEPAPAATEATTAPVK